MFDKHATKLSKKALELDSVCVNIGLLVLLSIRQPFEAMPKQFIDVMKHGDQSKYLFGWKREGYRTLLNRGAEFRNLANIAYSDKSNEATNSLILTLMEVQGMGIVKASFYAQMLINDGACLDSHNLTRLGMDASQFKTPKTLKLETVHKKLRAYNAVWRAEGSSAYWWDSWCNYLAKRPRNGFKSGFEVSEMHLLPLMSEQDITERWLNGESP